MNIINKQYRIQNSDGTFSAVHFETSAEQIITTEELQFISKQEKQAISNVLDLEFSQGNPSTQWQIVHNLNKFPIVVTMDNFNNLIVGEVVYLNKNEISINFNQPVSGIAYLK